MKFTFSQLIVVMFATLAAAQDSLPEELAPKPRWTKEQIENPPPRDLKIDLLRAPVRQSRGQNLLLAEQTHMAIVHLEVPVTAATTSRSEWSVYLDRTKQQTLHLNSGYLLLPSLRTSRRSPSPYRTPLKEFLAQVPAGKLEAKAIAFFDSAEIDQGLFHFRPSRPVPNGENVQEFTIYGRSAEDCNRLMKDLLTLLDYGFTRPMQLELLQDRERYVAEAEAADDRKKEADGELAQVNKKLEAYNEYTVEMLPMLRQQQMSLEVDLAGTVARIKACETLLANSRPALGQERRASVEDTKIQAEIGLAGIQAQRLTLMGFVSKVKEKTDLNNRHKELSGTISGNQKLINALPSRCKAIDADLDYLAPVKVVNNKIFIQPIEWAKE